MVEQTASTEKPVEAAKPDAGTVAPSDAVEAASAAPDAAATPSATEAPKVAEEIAPKVEDKPAEPDAWAPKPGQTAVARIAGVGAPVVAPAAPDRVPASIREAAQAVPVSAQPNRGNGTSARNETYAKRVIEEAFESADMSEEKPRPKFRVMKDAKIYLNGRAAKVLQGQIVAAHTHPLAAMRSQGVILNEIS